MVLRLRVSICSCLKTKPYPPVYIDSYCERMQPDFVILRLASISAIACHSDVEITGSLSAVFLFVALYSATYCSTAFQSRSIENKSRQIDIIRVVFLSIFGQIAATPTLLQIAFSLSSLDA